jgi:hypothetical protein
MQVAAGGHLHFDAVVINKTTLHVVVDLRRPPNPG